MNKKLILWSITVGLGGFLFGLDVAVISGAEKAIQQLWQLSNWVHGTAIAMALYGTAFGAAFGNIPADKLGRKKNVDMDRHFVFHFIDRCSHGTRRK